MSSGILHSIKKIIKRILSIPDPNDVEFLRSKGFKVGKDFNMREECIIDFSHSWHIEIGDSVTLAPRVHILAHDASTWTYLGYTKVRNTYIGNRVFIGASSIILPGIRIGNDVIVGAGSVVTQDIPDNSVYAGNPARFLMKTDEYIERERLQMRPENCFGREFSEANNVRMENKLLMKETADKFGTAFAK